MKIEPTLRGSILFLRYWEDGNSLRGAEVGVMNGVHAYGLLDRMPNVFHLYLIDPYDGDYAVYKTNGVSNLAVFEDRKTFIHKRFRDCTSSDIPEVLDFVYIDGDHSYSEVQRDLVKAVEFVKPFGVVCGHDYQMPDVRKAVEEYCNDNNRDLRTWGGEWWFINGDLSSRYRKMEKHKFFSFKCDLDYREAI
jgi:predicted O-methyltransferase YrrM